MPVGGKRLKESVVNHLGYFFWGGLVLALGGGMLLAVNSLTSKAQAPHKSVRLWKNLSMGAAMLAGVIILNAGLVAATAFRPQGATSPENTGSGSA